VKRERKIGLVLNFRVKGQSLQLEKKDFPTLQTVLSVTFEIPLRR